MAPTGAGGQSKEDTMIRIARTIATGLAVAGALSVAAVGTASAQQYGSYPLSPGQGACTTAQYAAYQVHGDVWATAQGAKFRLLRNGVVVATTPGRVNNWAVDLRTSYGTFPGAGYYTMCAQNTGTLNTIVTMQLRTDAEI
jgi:hypothetical protein